MRGVLAISAVFIPSIIGMAALDTELSPLIVALLAFAGLGIAAASMRKSSS